MPNLKTKNAIEARKKRSDKCDVQNNLKTKREKEMIMEQYIADTIQNAEEADKLTFFFAHVNYFYERVIENDKVEYCPAEIGIAKCSLQKGVEEVYHAIITPKIEKGYSADAIERSEKYFKLPIEPNSPEIPSSKNFDAELYNEIYTFLCHDLEGENKELPPIYTVFSEESYKNPTISFFEKLAYENGFDPEKFRIYSLEHVFFNLYNIKNSEKMDYSHASIQLKKDKYDYTESAACEYHQRTEAINHCSKSIAQRFMFTICDACCLLFNIQVIPGCHIPGKYYKSKVHKNTKKKTQLKQMEIVPLRQMTSDVIILQNKNSSCKQTHDNNNTYDKNLTSESDFPTLSNGLQKTGPKKQESTGVKKVKTFADLFK